MSKSHWVLTCRDAEDAAARRADVFASHVAYVKECPLSILLAGPLFDGDLSLGSLLVIADASREEVESFARSAPFALAGVWAGVRIERFVPVIARA